MLSIASMAVRRASSGLAPIATESHEVEVPHLLVALQTYSHAAHLI